MKWGKKLTPIILFILVFTFLTISCTTMKESRPLMPIKEYEKMLVGSLEADYIGNDNCLKDCHDHDQTAANLAMSVHGQQKDTGTGMPLVNCETCHGPGSEAVAHAKENKKCDVTKFVPIKDLPAMGQSLICLKCHGSYSMANMQFWPSSRHSQTDVSCSDCHKLHAGPAQKMTGKEINELCFVCHPETRVEFSFFSRHPLKEGKMDCGTCHEPHGALEEKGLRAQDQKGLCLKCHGEKVGPFLYEHGDVTDDCSNCHTPHGSAFDGLLRYSEPFLCLECHFGHTDNSSPSSPSAGYKRGFYSSCTNCHSQIHGTDATGATAPALIE